jgi:hypothetical protein
VGIVGILGLSGEEKQEHSGIAAAGRKACLFLTIEEKNCGRRSRCREGPLLRESRCCGRGVAAGGVLIPEGL